MMSLSKRKFDAIWYTDAAIGILSIFAFDEANSFVHNLSTVALIAAVGALMIGLFVRREVAPIECNPTENLTVQIQESADISASVAAPHAESNQTFEKQIAVLFDASGLNMFHRQPEGIDSLLYSYSEEWLSVQQNSTKEISEFYFEHISLHKSGISLRRNILREATEMARHLQGSEIEVSVTPENLILLTDVSTKNKLTSTGLAPEAAAPPESKKYLN